MNSDAVDVPGDVFLAGRVKSAENMMQKEEMTSKEKITSKEKMAQKEEMAQKEKMLQKEEMAPKEGMVREEGMAPKEKMLQKEEMAPKKEMTPKEKAIRKEGMVWKEDMVQQEDREMAQSMCLTGNQERGMSWDEIRIEGLEVYAHHGVFPEEKEKGQNFVVNAVLYTDTHRAGSTDELVHSTDYGAVCHFIVDWMQGRSCNLLEAVAEGLARAILLAFERIREIALEIRKPQAPIGLPFGCVSVKIHRKWARVYLAFGSNMGDKRRYIQEGIAALRAHPLIRMGKVSDIIVTKPYGGVEQEDFLNGVLEADTLLSPEELLDAVHDVENAAGRVRQVHWGPRTLDLDILFYDHLVYESDQLAIPHPDMQNRDFVLIPLNGVASNYVHPLLRKRVSQLLAELVNARD